MEQTKLVKLTDKAIVRMVSESPGHNASEPTGGLEKIAAEAELSMVERRQQDASQTDCRGAIAPPGWLTRAC